MIGDACEKGSLKEEIGSVCMDAKKLDTGLRDAISLLPQEVLGDILSLLPTKLAASTSVLSKKWRNVFALVHNLDFDDSVLLRPEERNEEWDVIRESFRNFVDRTIAMQCGSPIKKFSLKCQIVGDSEMAHVGRWISNAIERGVLEVDLSLKTYARLFLPCELFKSKTLVKLTLGSQISLMKMPPDVSLPVLKSLFIDSIFFDGGDLCYVFLPGCPVLEELFVRHEEEVGIPLCICSATIKKLSVYYDLESEIDFMGGMSFNAPSLVSLNYRDYALSEYPQVNLKSLVEARLDIHYSKVIKKPNLTGLIRGMSNVKTLHLSPASVDVISLCVKKHGLLLPVFNNLVNLSFGSKNKRGWKLLPYLLKQSPKLETVIIQGLDGYTSDLTMRVKVLH
ncbi:F-box/LRR-repeat protein At3g60040 isoform X2 [Eutrema salsugineum]|uniref:F-box/LRR-repeat protein At3g60040 isoform X2 n=1 Tax=Eutrema salsugineum TaxID=72664 RepID=UPI000CED40B4|nr:F-box/LRR-repeat protein At3g60040 isoform X2 [Eutrema salsugineum]